MSVGSRKRRRAAAGKILAELSFITSSSSTNSPTITVPSSLAQAGDLAVLADMAINTNASFASGWTPWGSHDSGDDAIALSYKVLESGDLGASVSTGMTNGTVVSKIMLVFRLSTGPITSVTASTANAEITDGNPAPQSVLASGGTPPLVVVCANTEQNTASPALSVESPSFDAVIGGTEDMLFRYKIYNSSPQDHNVDMNDLGTACGLASGYLSVS